MANNSAPVIPARPGILDEVKAAIGDAWLDGIHAVGEDSITVARESIAEVCRTLRDRFGYQQLMEIAGVDYPQREERFDVVYHLLSVTKNHRIRLRVMTDEEKPVPSVTGLWPVAGWLEREVFDMYGVLFEGNEDLRRILTDYGFRGHPLRKDFPLSGYQEMRYSEEEKRVVYEPVRARAGFPQLRLPESLGRRRICSAGDEKAHGQAPGAPTPAPAPGGGDKK
jgi:NADH-quinone oxidoreductase subunit C